MLYCNLIIIHDIATAHLALDEDCPLGCLKKDLDYQWKLESNDNPWYPNMKLYYQNERDN